MKLYGKAFGDLQPGHLGGQDVVQLATPPGEIVLKAYASPDGSRVRIVLPELKGGNFTQVKIDLDNGLLDFTRDPAAARRNLEKATKR